MKLREKIIDTLDHKNKQYKLIEGFIKENKISFSKDDVLLFNKLLYQVDAQIKILTFILSND